MKSGNINFLEPSGPLQACNGAALPFLIHIKSLQSVVLADCLPSSPYLHITTPSLKMYDFILSIVHQNESNFLLTAARLH
jgi:hypothetical protein